MQLLRTIAIILLVYYGLKIIGRFAFPIIFKRFVGKFEEKVRNQQQQQSSKSEEKIGETSIDKKPNSAKESNKDVGEYVDYEDVE
ncbi:MAG: DUF4834 domain-containing protein [Lutibacter sp.]|nr:MAG: DUF4834 domain-containing protein [Lutibacter sp.]